MNVHLGNDLFDIGQFHTVDCIRQNQRRNTTAKVHREFHSVQLVQTMSWNGTKYVKQGCIVSRVATPPIEACCNIAKLLIIVRVSRKCCYFRPALLYICTQLPEVFVVQFAFIAVASGYVYSVDRCTNFSVGIVQIRYAITKIKVSKTIANSKTSP